MDANCKLGDGTPCTVLSDERDDPKSPTGRCKDPTFDPDAMYSGGDPNSVISTIRPGTTTQVRLRKLRLFNGRVVPAHDIEEYGTILFIVQPDYLDWTDETAWGPIFEKCSVVMTGGGQAKSVTDESGAATIRVPATDAKTQDGYLVIAKLSADPRCAVSVEGGMPVPCSAAGSDPDAAYAAWTPPDTKEAMPAGAIVSIPIRQLRFADGSAVPARIVGAGSGIGLVAPDYVNWKTALGRFAIVVESQSDRTVTANVSGPARIVLDANRLTARPINGTAAMQFEISGAATESGADNALALEGQGQGTQTTVSGRVPVVDQRKPSGPGPGGVRWATGWEGV